MADSVTGIGLLMIGVFLLARGLPGVLQLLAARSWSRVSGELVSAGVAGYQTQAGAGHQRANVQRAAFLYRYQVGAELFTGTRAAFGTPLGFGAGLGWVVGGAQAGRYAPGSEVEVWFDPRDPSRSVLRRTAPSSFLMSLAGAVVLVLGLTSLAG